MSKPTPAVPERSLVAIDTNVLIWVTRGVARTTRLHDPHTRELERRAKILVGQLNDAKATVVVPTIVVAEFLSVPDVGLRHIFDVFAQQGTFLCPSFDLPASEFAAGMWRKHKTKPRAADPQPRPVLRVDIMIVATAKIAGAQYFYTADSRCRELANLAGMTARDLPEHSDRPLLDKLEDADDKT